MVSSFAVLAMWSHMAVGAFVSSSMALGGDYAYVSQRNVELEESFSLSVVDISDPTNPWVVALLLNNPDQLGGLDMAIRGNYVYLVGDRLNSTGFSIHWEMCDLFLLRAVSISDPTKPVIADSMQVPNGTLANNGCLTSSGITIVDDYAYVVGSFGMMAVVNISDPTDPVIAWHGSLRPANHHHNGIAIVGDYAYISGMGWGHTTSLVGQWNFTELQWGCGLTVVNISNPSAPRLTGWMHVQESQLFGSVSPSDPKANIAIVGDSAYIAIRNIVSCLNISDPSRPHLCRNRLGWNFGASTWSGLNSGMAVVEGHACFAFHSWSCFTKSSSSYYIPVKDSVVDAWALGPASVLGDYVYIAIPPGVAVYNISAPTNWSFVGSTPTTTRTSSTITTVTATATTTFDENAAQVVATSALAIVLGIVAHLQHWLAKEC